MSSNMIPRKQFNYRNAFFSLGLLMLSFILIYLIGLKHYVIPSTPMGQEGERVMSGLMTKQPGKKSLQNDKNSQKEDRVSQKKHRKFRIIDDDSQQKQQEEIQRKDKMERLVLDQLLEELEKEREEVQNQKQKLDEEKSDEFEENILKTVYKTEEEYFLYSKGKYWKTKDDLMKDKESVAYTKGEFQNVILFDGSNGHSDPNRIILDFNKAVNKISRNWTLLLINTDRSMISLILNNSEPRKWSHFIDVDGAAVFLDKVKNVTSRVEFGDKIPSHIVNKIAAVFYATNILMSPWLLLTDGSTQIDLVQIDRHLIREHDGAHAPRWSLDIRILNDTMFHNRLIGRTGALTRL